MGKKIYAALSVAFMTLLFHSLFTGCATQKNAEKFYRNNPIELAKACAEKYPPKDSVAPPVIVYKKADNVDFSRTIDSLKNIADSLESQARNDSIVVIGTDCAPTVQNLQKRISALSGQITDLKSRYKACVPDTVYLNQTIYRENTAKVSVLQNQNAVLDAQVKSWRKWFFIILGIAVVLGVPYLIKLFSK